MVRSRLQGGSAEGPTVRGFAAKNWRGARRQPRKNQTADGTPSAIHARRQAEPFGAGRAAGAPPPQARLVSSAPARRAKSVVIRAPQGPRMTGKRRGRRALRPGGGKSARIRAWLRRGSPPFPPAPPAAPAAGPTLHSQACVRSAARPCVTRRSRRRRSRSWCPSFPPREWHWNSDPRRSTVVFSGRHRWRSDSGRAVWPGGTRRPSPPGLLPCRSAFRSASKRLRLRISFRLSRSSVLRLSQ